MQPTKKQPLFIVTGASCVGKSTLCEELFKNERDYIIMESDLLWHEMYNTPEDNYCTYRKLWMNVCANISQIEKPVVLCGCNTPEQLENQQERSLFTDIHYLAVVCDEEVLRQRIAKRGVTDPNWIKSSVDFNNWLKENPLNTTPNINLLDTSSLTSAQVAVTLEAWIRKNMLMP